jgi:hypothetical protein
MAGRYRVTPAAELQRRQPQGRQQVPRQIHAQLRINQYVDLVGANALQEKLKTFLALTKMIRGGAQLSGQVIVNDMRMVEKNLEHAAVQVGDPAGKVIADRASIEEPAAKSHANATTRQILRRRRQQFLRKYPLREATNEIGILALNVAIIPPLIGEQKIIGYQVAESLRHQGAGQRVDP